MSGAADDMIAYLRQAYQEIEKGEALFPIIKQLTDVMEALNRMGDCARDTKSYVAQAGNSVLVEIGPMLEHLETVAREINYSVMDAYTGYDKLRREHVLCAHKVLDTLHLLL